MNPAEKRIASLACASYTEIALQEYWERTCLNMNIKIHHHQASQRNIIETTQAFEMELITEYFHRTCIATLEYQECAGILVNMQRNLTYIITLPLVNNEEWTRVEWELDELWSFMNILNQYNLHHLQAIANTLLSEAESEKNLILRNFSDSLSLKSNAITTEHFAKMIANDMRKTRRSHKTIYTEKAKAHFLNGNDPSTFNFSNKLTLPIPKNISSFTSSPCMASLNPLSRKALLENSSFICAHTPDWNLILKIYENPLKGIVMLRFSIPIEFRCSFSGCRMPYAR